MSKPETSADLRSDWAERMPEFGPDTIILEGDAARGAIADLLDGTPAVGGEEEVTRRLRGRPALNPSAPAGAKARQLNVRIPAELDLLVASYVQTKTVRNESELVRNALVEYFNNHTVPA
jgi:hypothetical protein